MSRRAVRRSKAEEDVSQDLHKTSVPADEPEIGTKTLIASWANHG